MKQLVVLPAFNEEHALPRTIEQLQALPDEYELLVVNDGSTDATARVAAELQAGSRRTMYVVNLPMNSGIGAAVQTGYVFAAQSGDYRYVIQFDADGQHDAQSVTRLVAECERRALDLCIGSRFLGEATHFRSTPLRRVGIRFFCGLIGMLSGSRVTDPTSGFRCAGPAAWGRFAQRYPDDFPEPESLFWCLRHRLAIGEVSVPMYARQGGTSSIRSWKSVYYMLKVTLAILVEILRRKEQTA